MRSRHGFTLVELLVVVAIIAILVGLLLPAVQAARAAARKTQCANNFRQVALATLNYASSTDQLPPRVDPHSHNGGRLSPYRTGWRFTILPYLEEQALYDQFVDRSRYSMRPVGESLHSHEPVDSVATLPCVVEAFLCPETSGTPRMYTLLKMVSTADGSVWYDGFATRQTSNVRWVHDQPTAASHQRSEHGAWVGTKKPFGAHYTDIEFRISAKLQWITDGLSKTILVVEQAGMPEWIQGTERGQDHWYPYTSILSTDGGHIHTRDYVEDALEEKLRWKKHPVNFSNVRQIFSIHPSGAHVSMCDGSVRFLSEGASPEAVFALAARANGGVIALSP